MSFAVARCGETEGVTDQEKPRRGDDFAPPSGKPTGDSGTGGISTGPHGGTPPQGEGPPAESGGSDYDFEAAPPGPPDDTADEDG